MVGDYGYGQMNIIEEMNRFAELCAAGSGLCFLDPVVERIGDGQDAE